MSQRPLMLVLLFLALPSCAEKPSSSVEAGPGPDASVSLSLSVSPVNVPVPVPVPVPDLPSPVSRSPSLPSALPPSAWKWQPYRGDHFTALFPGEPRVDVLPEEDDKAGYSSITCDVPGGQVSFAVGYTEPPDQDGKKPDEVLDAMVAKREDTPRRGTIETLTKRVVTLSGNPGRVMIQRRNISGTPLRIYSRLYLVNHRLYTLIVSTLDEGGIGEDAVKRFMESFKLV